MAEWVPFFASLVAAASSFAAAIVAARSASRTRDAQIQAERTFELEKRLAASRAEVYQPMVELLRTVFDSIGSGADVEPSQTREIVSKFTAWLQVYGSDNAVRSFHKFMQASYHNAPPAVLLRLYSEVVMAIRRDLGEPNTEVTLVDLLGMRITDIYETFAPGLQLDEQEFFGQNEWHPPWRRLSPS